MEHTGDAYDVARVYLKYYIGRDAALRTAIKDWMDGSLNDGVYRGNPVTVKQILWHLATWGESND